MLSNRVYLGHTQYGKRINLSYKSKKVKYIPQEEWKIAYNTHEAIIDEETFYKNKTKQATLDNISVLGISKSVKAFKKNRK